MAGLREMVGTLWSDEYTARHANDRALLEMAEVISVRDAFGPEEQAIARRLSGQDCRIQIALQSRDAAMTQVLAAGPDLVHRWEFGPDAGGEPADRGGPA